jgi:CRISPR-associated endonuclease Csy4
MNHYINITVLPDPEFPETVLLNALFAKLHRTLVSVGQGEIGISFPQVKKNLGNQLRLHGTAAALERFMEEPWLKGLRDYTQVSTVLLVPAITKYRVVKRVQAKSNIDRLLRRATKRGLSEDDAKTRRATFQEQHLKQPFLQLKSQSTEQNFRLFIEHSELINAPVNGFFSTYGLSSSATIPWF